EAGQRLNFDWEFSTVGADIMVPAPEQWDAYWEQSGAAWAKGRRQEILERVAEATRQQKAQNAAITIEDRWIVLKF
ncbi:MAG: hypothetical protein JOZ57_04610, partial [Abitibacteriaceae bacterium]|nr:hypothetical protein [Abditibacteriaceae bacterium]